MRPVLSVTNLSIHSEESRETIVHDVSFSVGEGQILGLAGESGSGKSLTAAAIMGILPEALRAEGEITFDGSNLTLASTRTMRSIRGRKISMIFQDPFASFHPMLSVGTQMTDHYRLHMKSNATQARKRAEELLARVRIQNPGSVLRKYPHQFSGGQLQRIAIATALMCQPELLIADEITTALDVSVQAEVLHLLKELSEDLGLSTILISHDFGVMSSLADHIVVMREGAVIEAGDRYDLINHPRTDYTRSLLEALPTWEDDRDSNEVMI